MGISDKKVILLVISIILGIVMSIQIRTTIKQMTKKNLSLITLDKLKEQLDTEKKIGKYLQEKINENARKKEEFLKSFVKDTNNDKLNQEWDKSRLDAGLVDVSGKGIIITLTDATIRQDNNLKRFVIHDSDLFRIVNECKKSGGQAISVNDERVISTSELSCMGPTIRINKKRYPTPFIIKAIGDPNILYDTVTASSIVNVLKADGINLNIAKNENIVITKFNGNVEELLSGLEVIEK